MRELIEQFWGYLQGIWRFRWYAAGTLWLVAVAGWAFSFQLPDQYRASAQIHVDTDSMLQPLLRGLVVNQDTRRQVDLMTRTLLSRPNLEKVARKTDLHLRARTPGEMDALLSHLESRISLSGTGRTNLYRVTYRGEDPNTARDVVQALVTLLVEESMGRSRQDTESATAFLDRKVQEYEARLEEAERRLMEFKQEHAGEMPGSGGDYYQRLQRRMDDLERARFELETALSRQRELQQQLAGETPVFGIMGGSGGSGVATPELDQRISNLRQRLDQLLLKYTQQHPQVVAAQDTLERLEQRRADKRERLAEEASERSDGGTGTPLAQNPVHQEIRAALARARSDVAAARSEVAQYEQQVQELQEKVDTIPRVEAQLQQLNRDYRTTKQTYEELLQRRQRAQISQEVKSSDNQIEFRIVEPPRVPNEPVAPDRPLLVTASLAAGIAGYGAMGAFLSLVWPAFYTRGGLYSALRLPVLGAVGRVRTARQRRRRWLALAVYALVVAGVFAAYAVAMAVATGRGLEVVQSVLDRIPVGAFL